MKFNKTLTAILLFLLLAVGFFAYKTVAAMGFFREVTEFSVIDCETVEGVASSEDITVDPETGMAFVSSVLRGLDLPEGTERQGAIIGYDLEAADPEPVNLTADFKQEFFPHGIGLYISPEGRRSLFVINHRADGDFVEIFDYSDGRLAHRRSVSGDLMHNPNDLIPVGPDSFYVSNDHHARSFNGQIAEDFLRLSKAYVLYFDGSGFKVVADGLNYPNGVNISSDGKTVYVAETLGEKLNMYNRDAETGELELLETLDVKTGADNIEIDAGGNLYIGAHPRMIDFIKHAKDNSKPAPSHVIKIAKAEDGTYSAEDIYMEKGGRLPASSVASPYKNKLLIGAVFAPEFMVCEFRQK